MKRIERDSQTPDRGFGRSVPHGAVAEIFVDQPTTHVVGMLANVGRLGCFVRTRVPVPDGVKVRLKVRNGESEFEASGEVTYLVPEKGVVSGYRSSTRIRLGRNGRGREWTIAGARFGGSAASNSAEDEGQFRRSTATIVGIQREAVLRDYVGGGGVGVGVLVGLVHGEARAPNVLESGTLGEEVAVHGIDVEDVERMRPRGKSGVETVDEALDELALEGIVEIDQQRRARPAKRCSVRADDAHGRARAMLPPPFSDVPLAMVTRAGLISTPITLRKANSLARSTGRPLPAPTSTKL